MEHSEVRRFRWYYQSVRLVFFLCVIVLGGCDSGTPLGSGDAPDDTPKGAIFGTEDGGDTWWSHETDADILYDIAAAGANTWVAVGTDGMIVRTTDGGENWLPVSSGTTVNLRSVANNLVLETLLAVGSAGTLIRSDDGGETWNPITSGVTGDLSSVASYINISLAVGAAGRIIRSTDGGMSWVSIVSPTTHGLDDVTLSMEPDIAYAVGNGGTILHSSDAGVTWSKIEVPDVTNEDWLTSVISPSPNHVYITGYRRIGSGDKPEDFDGRIIQTTDGGSTWSIITKPSDGSSTFYALWGVTFWAGQIVAVGTNGVVYVTTDNGEHWLTKNGAIARRLYNATYYSSDLGFAVGSK